jgi:hypothetical protein
MKRFSWQYLLGLCTFILLCIIDALSTAHWVGFSGSQIELNPIMRLSLQSGIGVFFLSKFSLTAVSSIAMLGLRYNLTPAANNLLAFGITAQAIVDVYHAGIAVAFYL